MTDQSKKELRKHVKEQKALMTQQQKAEISKRIADQIEQLPLFAQSQHILAYWSLDDEVSTHNFVNKWCEQKHIYLPMINGDTLKVVKFNNESDIVTEDKFGVGEPNNTEELTNLSLLDMVIVPGVAFDTHNNRMGRGKAFYDRLLKDVTAPKVGICFPCQLFETVPHDEHDVKMDIVICAE